MKKTQNLKGFGKQEFPTSKDYHLFNLLSFNRDIDDNNVRTIEKSIKKYGWKGIIQVIKTDIFGGVMKLYILDGGHRFKACQRLGIPFTFEVTEFKSRRKAVEFISDLNNSQKGWNTSNFLRIWSGLDIREYVKLKKVYEDTGFQISPLLHAYTFSGRHVEFRQGELSFPNEEESDKLISQLVDLNAYLPTKAFCRRAILKLMRQEKYNHTKMKKAVADYSKLVGGFRENEKELTLEFQKLIDNN